MNPTRILIIDDHAVLRGGLKMLIDAETDLRVVGEAGSLAEGLTLLATLHPDVITLDLSMPGPSGVAAVERLRNAAPAARIVVLTMHDDPSYVRAALALGAHAFVNKSAADSELITALRAVAAGGTFVDMKTQTAVAQMPRSKPAESAPVDELSQREREVLAAVAQGQTNQQVADHLGVSVKTIESYRARMMKKLGLKQRADLVRVAIELGLLKSDPSA